MPRSYEFDDDEPYVVIEKKSGTLSSFFVGIAVGAGLALLFAPPSGERTRRDLQRRARRAPRAEQSVATGVPVAGSGSTLTDCVTQASRGSARSGASVGVGVFGWGKSAANEEGVRCIEPVA